MSKKTFFLFILIVLLLIGAVFWFLFFRTTGEVLGPDGLPVQPNPFPFGQGTEVPVDGGSGGIVADPRANDPIDLSGGEVGSSPKLRQIWKEPVAGAVLISSATSTNSVRFVDRATGHIYEFDINEPTVSRLSNTTIPQIQEALWATSGREVVLRYLKDDSTIQSFYVMVPATSTQATSSSAVEGFFLPSGIREMASQGGRIMYINPSIITGSAVLSNMNGTAASSVMTSDLKDWIISWTSPRYAFFSAKPSGTAPGLGYILDTTNRVFTKLVDSMPGLTGTVSPSGTHAIVSAQDGRSIATGSFVVSSKTASPLSLRTLSDKCAWGSSVAPTAYCAVPNSIPAGTYPDDWYQGSVSFTDRIWKIDPNTGETDLILDPEMEVLVGMDITKISVGAQESHILFTNKKDMSLWLYEVR